MATVGFIGLIVAFVGAIASIACLLAGVILTRKTQTSGNKRGAASNEGGNKRAASQKNSRAQILTRAGHIATFVTCAALTVCCAVLVICFFVGDYSIAYVLNERSQSDGALSWFYKLSGLWAGREGSLLFWAWLISLFCTVIAARSFKNPARQETQLDARQDARPDKQQNTQQDTRTDTRLDVQQDTRLDASALLVLQIVLGAFVSVLLFSQDNMPFAATSAKYFKDGTLTAAGAMLGMNQLLEHWAMAAHPPTLFIGYAGLTVPFAYALGALITNDDSNAWTRRAHPFAMFSWLFLSVGIGLGSVWAYVVLGWGGYWGWDAVENASLLSWLVGLALIHSMTVCRQRGAFKRWAVMCACITFALVILGTFISRSGIVQSVHAFGEDTVSGVLFGALIVVGVLSGAVGLAIRWKSFGPAENGTDDVESLLTKEGAYYFNNVVMVISAVVIAYLTVSSALPAFLPFGGKTVSTGTYNAVARPLGIIYLLILSCCPLLSWGHTNRAAFFRAARVPGVCALVLFAVLAAYWAMYLVPSYDAIIAGGGTQSSELLSEGPPAYYNGLALFGFFVASIVFFNSLFMFAKHCKNPIKRSAKFGGFLAHTAMGIILVGLIGSSMYVTEVTQYIDPESDAGSEGAEMQVQDYTLKYSESSDYSADNDTKQIYEVTFNVYKGEDYVGQVSPSMEVSLKTQQQKLNAAVISLPTHDLFVVYQGNSESGQLSMDVRVNPLVSFVWVGFALLIIGMCVAAFGGMLRRRDPQNAQATEESTALPTANEAHE